MELPAEVAGFIDHRIQVLRSDVADMVVAITNKKDEERKELEAEVLSLRAEIRNSKLEMKRLQTKVLSLRGRLDMAQRKLSPRGKRILTPEGARNGQSLALSSNVQNTGHGPVRAGNQHSQHDGPNAV